ncbi:MAG: thymidine phosphorylase [Candidatus Kapabacteria bacterium]|nr:thymidine phosphorylase [Candidatus Kapabacteria bacterium]
MKSTKELLRLKRDGHAWTSTEIETFVQRTVSGEATSAQVAAFLMAACTRGLAASETAALTLAMSRSGDIVPTMTTSRPRIDKHSTGGVGDKVSLLLAPLAVACGLDVPMISGRGLGHTGGTLDKLESVKGVRTDLSLRTMQSLLSDHHLFMAGQTPTLVPADRIMYALRDVTGTVENVGLITASILSKKIAEGLDGLVMDMKVGSAAFLPDLASAEELATSMKSVCEQIGLPVTFVFTRMNRPLGKAVGNWVEVVEADAALAGMVQRDLAEVTTELVARMIMLSDANIAYDEARRRVIDVWRSGTAHVIFHEMLRRQGGDWAASIRHYSSLPSRQIIAETHGFVDEIDARALADVLGRAGAGRTREDDQIDPAVGVVIHEPPGQTVESGQPLASVHASTDEACAALAAEISTFIKTTTAPVSREPSMVIQVW